MSRKFEYALMALKIIKAKPASELTSAKEIADHLGISFEVTARVLQALSSKGLLKSEYGANGGYLLVKPLSEISLHDLSEMLDGHTILTKCLDENDNCEISSKCNIATPMTILNKKVKEFYKSVSLDEVLNVGNV